MEAFHLGLVEVCRAGRGGGRSRPHVLTDEAPGGVKPQSLEWLLVSSDMSEVVSEQKPGAVEDPHLCQPTSSRLEVLLHPGHGSRCGFDLKVEDVSSPIRRLHQLRTDDVSYLLPSSTSSADQLSETTATTSSRPSRN